MHALSTIAKKLQFSERVIPARWRLHFRYHAQRMVGGFEAEMGILRSLVRPGGVALDIGANRGVYAYALAGYASAVHCFEPLAECCEYIRAARLRGVTVHNCALSDVAGTLRFYIPTARGVPIWTRASLKQPGGTFDIRDVEVRTLDGFTMPRVDFMKIDVEGAESAVLRGAADLLERDHPNLLVEIDRERHSQATFEEVVDWLVSRSYGPHVLEDGKLRRAESPWADATSHFNFIFLNTRTGI
jgi:FkbM family methyltransferase